MPGAMCRSPDTYECKCANASGGGHSWLGPGQTLAQQAQAMHEYTAGQPDASCATHYGHWGAWRCYLGQYSAVHLESTTLLLQSQIDEWQGFWNGFFAFASEQPAFAYASWFRSTQRRALQESAAASAHLFAFSPNCYHHGLSYDQRFWMIRTDGWSAATMLASLLIEHRAEVGPRLVMDNCAGLPCSPETSGYDDECAPVHPPSNAIASWEKGPQHATE
jgi:hypothetical protein